VFSDRIGLLASSENGAISTAPHKLAGKQQSREAKHQIASGLQIMRPGVLMWAVESAREKSDFRGGRIDDQLDFRDTVGREPSLFRMLENDCFVGSNIDAVNLVGRHIAVQPLDRRTKMMEDTAGFLRDSTDLIRWRTSNSQNATLSAALSSSSIYHFMQTGRRRKT